LASIPLPSSVSMATLRSANRSVVSTVLSVPSLVRHSVSTPKTRALDIGRVVSLGRKSDGPRKWTSTIRPRFHRRKVTSRVLRRLRNVALLGLTIQLNISSGNVSRERSRAAVGCEASEPTREGQKRTMS
jgi:hypothetical protein